MLKDYATVLIAALLLAVMLALGCDEESIPEVHGVISVSPSPLPPFEVRFRDEGTLPSPTPEF